MDVDPITMEGDLKVDPDHDTETEYLICVECGHEKILSEKTVPRKGMLLT
jgi:hypothetical protein